ncbi:HAD-IA family hydrolase [Streptomyces sp. NPDC001815]|uniref:HAD family hydrolase n=1 Tax=unclassified Streptomyces TaxID=2593676 RepID=UPI0033292B06
MVRRPLGNHHDGPDTLLVTSDTAQTEQVTAETEKLRELIKLARYVAFDFDGPICRLFAGHRAELIADEQVRWLGDRGLHGLLTPAERDHPDPHVVLRAVNERHPGSDLAAELEERLTQHELRAAASAMPTAFADPLIRTWTAVGARLAIVTNNSARTAYAYLAGRGLTSCFDPHVYGRTQELHLMKPDPYRLNQALSAMGAAPSSSLMIGDAPSDYVAAQAAGTHFLGYARNERKYEALRKAEVEPAHIVTSLEPVLHLLRAHP